MRKIICTLLIAFLATAFCVTAEAQSQPTRYTVTKTIHNRKAEPNDFGHIFKVRYEGNLMYIDMGVGTALRYIYDHTESNGNQLYYGQAYNYGTMAQGRGYVTDNNRWAWVSGDKSTINMLDNNGKSGFVLKIGNANVGEMIE